MQLKTLFLGKASMSALMRRAAAAALAGTLLAVSVAPTSADEYVSGYYRSSGTYVQGYYRSDRDGSTTNNYSFYGNYDPYTGARGTHRDKSFGSSSDRYGLSSSRSWSSHQARYGGSSFGRGRR